MMNDKKRIYLLSETVVSPSLLQGVDFGKTVKDNFQELKLEKIKTFDKDKKYILNVKAPVTHGNRLTLKQAVYLPRGLKSSARSFYHPNYLPVIKEHKLGLDNSGRPVDAIGRVKMATYQDFNPNQLSRLSLQDAMAHVQAMMRDGTIYNQEWHGDGAIFCDLKISDKNAIEQFIDERIMNFSVGGYTDEVYSPFNGKHIYDLEDGDLGPFDELDGMPGFKVVDNIIFDELSTTLAPADLLAKVESMELEEFKISDSIKENNYNKINTKKTFFDYGLFQIELEGEKRMSNEFSLKDYCGPDQSFPVTNKEQAIKALEELKDSNHDNELKAKIEKAIKIKLDSYNKKEKSIFTSKEELKDSVSKLTTFEVLDFIENLKENLKDSLDEGIIAELFGVKDTNQESKRILEEKNKNLNMEIEALKNQNQDLKDSLSKAQKSFVFIAKAIKNNTEITNFDSVAEEESTVEDYENFLKDNILLEKLKRIFDGLDPNKVDDKGKLESDVHNTSNEDKEQISDTAGLYKQLYDEKVKQDGLQKANKWLKSIKDSNYISEKDFNLLIKEN